jgi:hypothetical protein
MSQKLVDSKILMIQFSQGNTQEGLVEFSLSPPWVIEFTCSNTPKIIFSDNDLFECLIQLRQKMVQKSCIPLCNGARRDVYPSRMSREMGGGIMGYVHQLNKHPTNDDLVNIFDYAEPNILVSVDEQKKFHRLWLDSLK